MVALHAQQCSIHCKRSFLASNPCSDNDPGWMHSLYTFYLVVAPPDESSQTIVAVDSSDIAGANRSVTGFV